MRTSLEGRSPVGRHLSTRPEITHRRRSRGWPRRWSTLGVLALALASLSVFVGVGDRASAQDEAVELELGEAIVDADRVDVTVVAPDGLRGVAVDENSFGIDVDGVPVVPSVTAIEGEELDVVLLVDVSGSMTADALQAAKDSGLAFIAQLPERTRVAVVAFGDEVTVVRPFTSDIETASAAFDGLQAGGETALYAAVVEAARQFEPDVLSIRTVVLLSDGGNTVDESSLGNAQAALISSGATLHAISIETDESNRAELDALAEASGGTVARVEQVDALRTLYSEIAADLANQYRLRFTAPGSGPVTVRIDARRDGQTVARTSFGIRLPDRASTPVPTTAPLIAPVVPAQRPDATAPATVFIEGEDNLLLKWGAIAALSVAIGTIAFLILVPGQGRVKRVKPKSRFSGSGGGTGGGRTGVGWIADRLTGGVDRLLLGNRAGAWLSRTLDTAGWKIRNSEFVVLLGIGAAISFFSGLLGSMQLALSLTFLFMMGVGLALALLVRRRRDAFANQLNGTLQMMAGALRTGYSLPQVFALVSREAEAPTSEEFSRIMVETRLGRDLIDATEGVARRMKNPDLEWTVGAMEIARDIGGDLAEVLDNVAGTVRTRERVRRQILALSAEGRISAWILMGMPFPIFFWQLIVNRDYTMLLFTDPLGRTIFFGGVSLLVVGGIWLNRLIQVRY